MATLISERIDISPAQLAASIMQLSSAARARVLEAMDYDDRLTLAAYWPCAGCGRIGSKAAFRLGWRPVCPTCEHADWQSAVRAMGECPIG